MTTFGSEFKPAEGYCPVCGKKGWPEVVDGSVDGTPQTFFKMVATWHCYDEDDSFHRAYWEQKQREVREA